MLDAENSAFRCRDLGCGAMYSVIRGVPALVPDGTPLLAFRNDFDNMPTPWRRFRRAVRARLPNIVLNVGGHRGITHFLDRLASETIHPVILNMGEKHAGPVLKALHVLRSATILHADNALGPATGLLVDFCRLPFANGSIDGVAVDSGFEHLVDPTAAVREVSRVLRPDGLVYVDMPFMMPVHAGPSDFQRFSANGLRMLFRDFETVERGVSCGPAMALTQMIQYCMLSVVQRQWARVAVKLVCRFTLFWIKYLDLILVQRPGAMDAAAGTYLIGRKSERRASDDEIIAGYRGIVPSMYEPLNVQPRGG
jgi:SAM-dependent methyltransferase